MIQQKYKEVLDLLDEELLEFNLINNQLRNQAHWLITHTDPEIQQRGKKIEQLTQQIDDFLDKISKTFQQHLQPVEPLEIPNDQQPSLQSNKHLEYLMKDLTDLNRLIDSFGTRTSMIRENLEKRKQQILKEIEEIRKQPIL